MASGGKWRESERMEGIRASGDKWRESELLKGIRASGGKWRDSERGEESGGRKTK